MSPTHILREIKFCSLESQKQFFQYYPNGILTLDQKRRNKRNRRRWIYADKDSNKVLTKSEYDSFLFPKTSSIWVPEALEELDTNFDEKISKAEFLAMPDSKALEKYFVKLDRDKNEFLDLEEIAEWIAPQGFVQAKSEVIYLIHTIDNDNSKDLSLPEIMNHTDVFLSSQITYFGKIYSKDDFRKIVFQL